MRSVWVFRGLDPAPERTCILVGGAQHRRPSIMAPKRKNAVAVALTAENLAMVGEAEADADAEVISGKKQKATGGKPIKCHICGASSEDRRLGQPHLSIPLPFCAHL